MNILFVCTGNISRSYLAKALLQNEIEKNHLAGVNVSSAGTGAFSGTPADPEMSGFLKEKHIPCQAHSSKMVSREDIVWADLILVMERCHRDFMVRSWPESKAKIEMLGKYIASGQTDDEIIDPYGRSLYHYRLVQSQIMLAVSNLAKTLLKDE